MCGECLRSLLSRHTVEAPIIEARKSLSEGRLGLFILLLRLKEVHQGALFSWTSLDDLRGKVLVFLIAFNCTALTSFFPCYFYSYKYIYCGKIYRTQRELYHWYHFKLQGWVALSPFILWLASAVILVLALFCAAKHCTRQTPVFPFLNPDSPSVSLAISLSLSTLATSRINWLITLHSYLKLTHVVRNDSSLYPFCNIAIVIESTH